MESAWPRMGEGERWRTCVRDRGGSLAGRWRSARAEEGEAEGEGEAEEGSVPSLKPANLAEASSSKSHGSFVLIFFASARVQCLLCRACVSYSGLAVVRVRSSAGHSSTYGA